MTQTLKDAIRVCKALSIDTRYLWVDSVSIIQDSQEDWKVESASVALVYKHALVVLAALSSSSCHESFLRRDRRYVEVDFHSNLESKVRSTFNLVDSGLGSSSEIGYARVGAARMGGI